MIKLEEGEKCQYQISGKVLHQENPSFLSSHSFFFIHLFFCANRNTLILSLAVDLTSPIIPDTASNQELWSWYLPLSNFLNGRKQWALKMK